MNHLIFVKDTDFWTGCTAQEYRRDKSDSPSENYQTVNPSTNRVTRSRNFTFDKAWIPNVESFPRTPIANVDNSDDEETSNPRLQPPATHIPGVQQEPA